MARSREERNPTWIVYAATQTKKDEKGEEIEYRFLKWYFVFNIEQTERISRPDRPPVKPIAEVEEFIDALGANVIHGNTSSISRSSAPDSRHG